MCDTLNAAPTGGSNKRKIPTRDSWTAVQKTKAKQILLEDDTESSGGGEIAYRIGKNPREISANEFHIAGLQAAPILAVIRAKCLDCCGEQPSEVRKCVDFACPNWPYRMGENPFRSQNISEQERERRRERGRRLTANRK